MLNFFITKCLVKCQSVRFLFTINLSKAGNFTDVCSFLSHRFNDHANSGDRKTRKTYVQSRDIEFNFYKMEMLKMLNRM